MKVRNQKRQFVSKSGDTWEWEETPETIEALKKLHQSVTKVNKSCTNL